MTYLGTARIENGHAQLPEEFGKTPRARTYEVIDIAGDILLVANPLDRIRIERIEALAAESIEQHRKSLDGLAK